jgi:hypothetical protein
MSVHSLRVDECLCKIKHRKLICKQIAYTDAVFGRMLKTRNGRVATLAYWQQEEAVANNEVPYFGKV